MGKPNKNKAIAEKIKRRTTLNIAKDTQKFIQGALHPNPFQMSHDSDSDLHAERLVSGEAVPDSLMPRIPELLANDENFMPWQKTAEAKTIKEIAIRAAMELRPEHFASINDQQPVTYDTLVEISHDFMKEFASTGAMSSLVSAIREEITKSKTEHKDDYLSFFNDAVSFVEYICSDNVKNPYTDPLNKHVDNKELERLIELEQWIPNNRTDPEFNQCHIEYISLQKKICKARRQALQGAGEAIFDVLKKIDPKMACFSNVQAAEDSREKRFRELKRNDFIEYIHKQYPQKDIFEPNKLRGYWETVYRNQYGEVCYQIVCESFQENYQNSKYHQLVKNIWAVSILDTSHKTPVDARSRMPGSSGDGVATRNFGYAMDDSPAHQQWYLNELARACGDVIVDVMQSLVDFALQLDLDTFKERFQLYLKISNSKQNYFNLFSSDEENSEDNTAEENDPNDTMDYYLEPHPYDHIMTDFAFYLLKYGFGTEFVSGDGRNVVSELFRVAGNNKETILTRATQHIKNFVTFSKNLAKLRPDNSNFSANAHTNGFVFGIGFKGQRFAAGGKRSIKDHEIHLAFSNAGRGPGGQCFLKLLKSAVRSPYMVAHQYNFIESEALLYERYHDLIQRHLGYQLRQTFYVPDNHRDNDRYNYIFNRRKKLEDFLIQCEGNQKYTELTSRFKAWLRKPSNWYFIPSGVSILTPKTITQDEYAAHELARKLIFDAVAGRSFSQAYPELIPILYQAWQAELYTYFSTDKNFQLQLVVKNQDDYTQLCKNHKADVTAALDVLAKEIHPDLQASWQEDINIMFCIWRKRKEKDAKKQVDAAKKNYGKFMGKNQGELQEVKLQVKNLLLSKFQSATRQLQELPSSIAELPETDYQKLREEFFQQSNLAQCIEPAFARSLGHDRFFSVMLSKKSGHSSITDASDNALQLGNRFPQDVIIPCRNRCQRHVMGHLYMSDMLGEQSADSLHNLRTTHRVDGVPDRLSVLPQSIPIAK